VTHERKSPYACGNDLDHEAKASRSAQQPNTFASDRS
jgi:hypothetical protein